MKRDRTGSRRALAATVALVVLTALWAAVPAFAGRPGPLASAGFTHDAGDCSIDFSATVNTRGRAATVVVAHYRQAGTANGASYGYFTGLQRGQDLQRTLAMPHFEAGFGTTYEIGYTAFAKNGTILEVVTLGFVDNAACL